MSNYIEAITCTVLRTRLKLYFRYPKMDYDEFGRIIIASKNCELLIFDSLTFIKCGAFNFGLAKDYKIKRINLHDFGSKTYSDWSKDKT